MRMKRITLILLSLVMVLSCVVAVPFSVAAENDTATGADMSTVGYKASLVQPTPDLTNAVPMGQYCEPGGQFPHGFADALTITINSPEELKMFADRVNEGDGFTNKTIVITADLDMYGIVMTSIGAYSRKGTVTQPVTSGYAHTGLYETVIYGGGHTISNLILTADENVTLGSFGLIGCLWGQLYDLRMDETCVVSVTNNNMNNVGGLGSLVGFLSNGSKKVGKIVNCYSAATVQFVGKQAPVPVGGIVGNSCANGQQITNCTFAGTVLSNGRDYIGGILGCASRTNLLIQDCVNYGEIAYGGTEDQGDVGGILGNFTAYVHASGQNVTINNCANFGTLTSKSATLTWLGGITAFVRGHKNCLQPAYDEVKWTLNITNCTSSGTLIPNYAGKKAENIAVGAGQVNALYGTLDAEHPVYNTGSHITPEEMAHRLVINESNNKVVHGYDADRIIKKTSFSDCFVILPNTTAADLAAATEKEFVIYDPAALLQFSILSDDAAAGFTADKTVYLGADMDMSGIVWEPICNSTANFKSTFDGQGHVISNLVNVAHGAWKVGFFGRNYSPVKNVVIDNTCYFRNTGGYAGAISSHAGAGSQIINCFNAATVMSNGNTAAGIARGDTVRIIGCTNAGLITDPASNAGTNLAGIFGGFSNNTKGGASGVVINCANYGNVIAKGGDIMAAAGIASRVGRLADTVAVLDNVNYGAVVVKNGAAAGIAHFDVFADDQATAETNLWNEAHRLLCCGNVNYGAIAQNMESRAWTSDELVVTTYKNKLAWEVPSTIEFVSAFNNTVEADTYGYSSDRIWNKAADYSKVPDIKDVFSVTTTEVEGVATVSVTGTAQPLMKITDAEGLDMLSAVAYFAPNSFNAGHMIVIVNDIDMTGWSFSNDPTTGFTAEKTFIPIGWQPARTNILGAPNETGTPDISPNKFDHVVLPMIDGLGHSIKNWNVDASCTWTVDGETAKPVGGNAIALFGKLNNATIQNLIIDESCSISNPDGATDAVRAGIATFALGSQIINCKNEMDLTVENQQYTGGIVAYANRSAVLNCTNNGDIRGAQAVGGIAGVTYFGTIANNRNNGKIVALDANNANNLVGGIIGKVTYDGTAAAIAVYNNLNVGKIFTTEFIVDEDDTGIVNATAGTIIGSIPVVMTTPEASEDGEAKPSEVVVYCYASGNINLGAVIFGEGVDVEPLDVLYANGVDAQLGELAIAARAEIPAEFAELLTVKYQLATNSEKNTDVRLVTAVDSLEYVTVGFIISVPAGEGDPNVTGVELQTVYTSILGGEETYVASDVGGEAAEYLAVHALTGVVTGTEVTAFVVTANGTIILGDTVTIEMPAVEVETPAA